MGKNAEVIVRIRVTFDHPDHSRHACKGTCLDDDAARLLVRSRTESLGLVALEAQACGTPVVAADVGGLRSVVAGGALVPGHDPEAHAAAVVQLLTDRSEHAAAVAAGLQRAERATWEQTLEDLVGVYESVSTRRPSVAARNLGA
jgi:D-inositol-3-phosphate glycosyltransferase